MVKRTRKVGICGRFGPRYGSSLRKMAKKMVESQHATYFCPFCGKKAIKRTAVGIWKCKRCKRILAGGAYQLTYSNTELQAEHP